MADNKELRDLLDEEAAAAEDARGHDDDAPLPPHVKVSRPNRARSKVLQVRLNPEEFEAIEQIAALRNLPASTVARDWLLRLIREDQMQADEATAAALVEKLFSAASQLRDITHSEGVLPTS